ncbi:MAG TPA: hypothetical protein VF457_02470, partial [Burkholderiaceae bacterium]
AATGDTAAATGGATPGGASTTDAGPTPAAADPKALANARGELDAALSKVQRCTADSDCRTVATGGKACGGPTAYRAYSTLVTPTDQMEALAARERQLSLANARASGRVSPCFMLADPGAHCEAHQCTTAPPGNNAGALTR